MGSGKIMGFETPDDKPVPVTARTIRDWNAMKLAIWRSRLAWDLVIREATMLVERAAHMTGCPGKSVETEPCLIDCPDRETRMSALVILNAARQSAPTNVQRPADAPYFAPSREYFSEVLAELAAAQTELEAMRVRYEATLPPAAEPKQLKEAP